MHRLITFRTIPSSMGRKGLSYRQANERVDALVKHLFAIGVRPGNDCRHTDGQPA